MGEARWACESVTLIPGLAWWIAGRECSGEAAAGTRSGATCPSHMSQTLIRPIGANSELSLTLDSSEDLNLIPWKAVLAHGRAFRILRVSIPHQSDCLFPATHLKSSGAEPSCT